MRAHPVILLLLNPELEWLNLEARQTYCCTLNNRQGLSGRFAVRSLLFVKKPMERTE